MKIRKILTETSKIQTLNTSIKNKINRAIYRIVGNKYFDKIPLQDIFDVLDKFDIVILQEDNSKWSGILVGRYGQTYFPVASKNSNIGDVYVHFKNTLLALSWYKMQSDNYEIVSYMT